MTRTSRWATFQREYRGELDSNDVKPDNTLEEAQADVAALNNFIYGNEESTDLYDLVEQLNTLEGAPLIDVIEWASTHGGQDTKALLDLTAKTKSVVNGANVLVGFSQFEASDLQAAGTWNFKTNSISILPKREFTQPINKLIEQTADSIAHEVLHPIVQVSLDKSKTFYNEVERIRNVARDWMAVPANRVKVKAIGSKAEFYMDYAITGIDDVENNKQDSPIEFLSTAMGSENVRRVLALIPDPSNKKSKGIFQSLKDAILSTLKRLTNNNDIDGTVLARALELTSDAINRDTPPADRTKFNSKPKTPKPPKPTTPATPATPEATDTNVYSPRVTKLVNNFDDAFDLVRLTGKSRYLAKDQLKADIATKFIGRGVRGSSTAQYIEDYGPRLANSGSYTSDDIVFVSVNGKRRDRYTFDSNEIGAAIKADAVILTDVPKDRARDYNIGEREVAQFLTDNNYTETSDGVWESTGEVEVEEEIEEEVEEVAEDDTDEDVEEDVEEDAEEDAEVVSDPSTYSRPTKPTGAWFDTLTQEEREFMLERYESEERVREGKDTLFSFEDDGEFDKHVGALTNDDIFKRGMNLVRVHMPSKHSTPLSYSKNFIKDVLLDHKHPLEALSYYMERRDAQKQIKKFETKGNYTQYKRVLEKYHNKWVDDLQRFIQPNESGYRFTHPISYFFKGKTLDSNVASAIAMSGFSFTAESGTSLRTNHTDTMIRNAAGMNGRDEIPEQLTQILSTAGVRERNAMRSMGLTAWQYLDLTLPPGTPRNEKELIVGALGMSSLTLLLKDGLFERNVYNGLEVTVDGVNLVEKFDTAGIEVPQELIEGAQANAQELRTFLDNAVSEAENDKAYDEEEDTNAKITAQDISDYVQMARARHAFIRDIRKEQDDVKPLFDKFIKNSNYNGERITPAEFNEKVDQANLPDEEATRLKSTYRNWLRGKRSRKQMPVKAVSEIVESARGSRSFIDSLMGRDKQVTGPTTDLSEAGYSPKEAGRNDVTPTKEVIEALDKAAKNPVTINSELLSHEKGKEGIWTRLNNADPDFIAEMHGKIRPGAFQHVDSASSAQAKDENIEREVGLLFDHINEVQDGDVSKPFYKRFRVWSNNRIGELSAGFNSQASKLHRLAETAVAWQFQVDPDADSNDLDLRAFKFGVAQALGFSVDKKDPASTIQAFNDFLADPDILEAAAMVQEMLEDTSYTLSKTDRNRLLDIMENHVAVRFGEGAHFFKGITELAKFLEGKPFTSDISAEVDGRTSGPAITLIQNGMTSGNAMEKLALAGMLPVGTTFSNAGAEIENSQNDLYKVVVRNAVRRMEATQQKHQETSESGDYKTRQKGERQLFNYKRRRVAVMTVLGNLTSQNPDDGLLALVTGLARDAVKEPVTANVFGAGGQTLVDAMTKQFMEQYYARTEEFAAAYKKADEKDKAAIKAQADQFIDDINGVLNKKHKKIAYSKTADYTKTPLTFTQKVQLQNALKFTLANATSRAIEEEFKQSRDLAQDISSSVSTVQGLYKAAFNAEKRAMLKLFNEQAIEKGERLVDLQTRSGNKKRGEQSTIHQTDLTAAQFDQIMKDYAPLFPMMQSAHSLLSAEMNPANGVSAFSSKTDNQDSVDLLTGRVDALASGTRAKNKLKHDENYTPESSNGRTEEINNQNYLGQVLDDLGEGVGALAKLAHALDARPAIAIMAAYQIINAHDGFTVGARQLGEVGQMANKEFLQAMADFSSGEQVVRMVVQTADAFDAIKAKHMGDELFVQEMIAALPVARIKEGPDKGKMRTVKTTPIHMAMQLADKVQDATVAKFTMLANIGIVDQYFYPDSAYIVPQEVRDHFWALAQTIDIPGDLKAMRPSWTQKWPTLIDTDMELAHKKWISPQGHVDRSKQLKELKHYKRKNSSYTKNTPKVDPNKIEEPIKIEPPTEQQKKDYWEAKKGDGDRTLLRQLNPKVNIIKKTKGHLDPEKTLQEAIKLFADESKESRLRESIFLEGINKDILHIENGKLDSLKETYFTMMGVSVNGAVNPNRKMATPPQPDGALAFNSSEVFDALNQNEVSPVEAAHLKNLLAQITGFRNTGSNTEAALQPTDMGETMEDLASRHLIEDIGPFTSSLRRAGINLTLGQSFVAEQIELTMQDSLAAHTMADNALVKLFDQAKAAMNPDGSDFYLDAQGNKASRTRWNNATEEEQAQARQAYELIFTAENNTDESQSDQLSRFIALALTYPPLRNQFNALGQSDTTVPANERIGDQLSRYYNQSMESAARVVNGTNRTDSNVKTLEKLAKRLALNEHKRRLELHRERNKTVDFADDYVARGLDRAQEQIGKIARSKSFAGSDNLYLSTAGEMVNVIAEDRVNEFVDLLQRWREHDTGPQREGLAGNIINEIRGQTDQNSIFYKLLRFAKRIEQKRKEKKDVIQDEILSRFLNSDKISKEAKAAITQLYLRSDLAALQDAGYSMEEIHDMVLNRKNRKQRIIDLQNEVIDFATDMGVGKKVINRVLLDTTEMAYDMASGRVVSEAAHQNADSIVAYNVDKAVNFAAAGKNQYTITPQGQLLTNIVDQLGSLLALDQAPSKHFYAAQEVIKAEKARGNLDGLSYLVGLHRNILSESRESLFKNTYTHNAIKGYLRESYNPYKTYKVVDAQRGKELLDMGYELYGDLQDSRLAVNKTNPDNIAETTGRIKANKKREGRQQLYVYDGSGLADYQTGAMLNYQNKARGTDDRITSFEFVKTVTEQDGTEKQVKYYSQKKTVNSVYELREKIKHQRFSKLDPFTYRPGMKQQTHDAPIYNDNSAVTGFRYKASHQTRDEAMERDNRFESVLGQTAATIYNKEQSVEQNKNVVDELHAFYQADFIDADRTKDRSFENRYITISPNASDARSREAWDLLPGHTKAYAREKFGMSGLIVRKDLADIVLGYRNLTTDVVINQVKEKIDRAAGKQVVSLLLGEKQALKVRRYHDHVADIMRRYKDFIVVKNATTLYNNIKSNMMLLFMYDVPVVDLIKGHGRGIAALKRYRDTQKEILRVQTTIQAANPDSDLTQLRQQLKSLEHTQSRNPVAELVDAGMYQTIMDDIDLDRENTVFRTKSEEILEDTVGKLPNVVQETGKQLFVAQDTTIYKSLAQITQQSDFIARFVLHEHLKKQKVKDPGNPLYTKDRMLRTIEEAFVNYNRPTDQRLQYLNDIGLVRFTKYALGTQKIIFQRIKEKPTKAMLAYMASRYADNANIPIIGNVDTILDSNIITNLGNPLEPSILDSYQVLDEPITLSTALGFAGLK